MTQTQQEQKPTTYRYTSSHQIGEKGLETFQRLQDALVTLMEVKPWSQVTMRDVARLGKSSAPAVYTFVRSLDDLVLVTEQALLDSKKPVPSHLSMVANLIRWERSRGIG